MRRILIVGAGGHGKVVADVVRVGGAFEVAAFADESATQRDGDQYLGARVFAGDGALERARRELGLEWAIVAFGDCAARLGCCERLRAYGFEIGSAVHPRAVVADDVTIGAGTVVLAGAVVNTAARLGDAVIVNLGAIVDHDADLDDGVHVEPGAVIGARVRVGRATTVGMGARIYKNLRVGAHARIAIGAAITADVPDGDGK